MRQGSRQLNPLAALLIVAAMACSSNGQERDAIGAPGDRSNEASVLVPVTAVGSRLILQNERGALFLWEGGAGDATALDLGPEEGMQIQRVLIGGPVENLLLIWELSEVRVDGTLTLKKVLTLLDLSSGERRVIADDARLNPVMTNRAIVWSDDDGLVHIWEIERELKSVLEASRTAPAEGLAAAEGLIAWSSRTMDSGPSEIHVIDLETGEHDVIEASGSVAHVVLTQDGAYLAWTEDNNPQGPAFYAMERQSGETRRFLERSDGMTLSGMRESDGFVSWRADPGDGAARAGYYDLANDRLHFIEPEAGRRVMHSGVLGGWFFWVEAELGDGDAIGPPEVFLRPLR
jgi:hypothetical protein